MRTEYYKSLEDVVSELVDTLYDHFGSSPMAWTEVDRLTEYLLGDQYIDSVTKLIDSFSNSAETITSINPSHLIKIIYKYQLATKCKNYDVNTITSNYCYIANYSVQVRNKRIQEIESFLRLNNFCTVTDSDLSAINYLNATIRGLSEVLYCDEHTISGEIFAPLSINKHNVVVRDFNYLNPFQLYTVSFQQNISRITIYSDYSSKCVFSTNLVGNIICNTNYAKELKGIIIQIYYSDGTNEILNSFEDCNRIAESLAMYMNEILVQIQNMSIKERLWHKILCEHFAFSPVNKNWRPCEYQLDTEIVNSNYPIVDINRKINTLTSEKEIKELLFTLNNPRKHYYY